MKTVFIRGNRGDFANYTAALAACGAEPVLSMDPADAERCGGLLDIRRENGRFRLRLALPAGDGAQRTS